MHVISCRLGPLDCSLVRTAGRPAEALVVLCHGYGDSRHGLTPLAGALATLLQKMAPPAPSVAFLLPEGPISLAALGAPSARAWWPLDAEMLMARAQAGPEALRQLQQETFAGVPAARRLLRQCLEAALAQEGLGYARLLLGGFSQGAMLTTDLTLRLEEPPAALATLSGTLIDAPRWHGLASKRTGLRVLQSHGRQDAVLPFAGAEALRALYVAAHMRVDWLPFDGGHTVPEALLPRLGALILEVIRAA